MPKKKVAEHNKPLIEEYSSKPLKKMNGDPSYFVGIDHSYNSFAIIVIDKDGKIVEQKLLSSDSTKEPEDRILELEKGFSFIKNIVRLHTVHIEGPSFSSNGAFVLQMGALHYYLRMFLRLNNIKYNVVAPNTLKKYITGKGNTKKNLILMKVYKRWGIEFDCDDLADAYGLAQMALEDYKNEKDRPVTK